MVEAAGVDQVKARPQADADWLATAPTPDRASAVSEGWWRRRESNPRPKARRRGTLHACPLRDCQARRVETAKYRRALASEKSRGHAPRRRVATSLLNGVRPSTTRR